MAKVTAPLLSFGASGTIGDTQVYSTWRGVAYARRHVIPANPQSPGQTLTRLSFAWLVGLWKLLDPKAQEPWNAFAAGRPFTGRNAIVSKNNGALRSATDITGLVMSPGARGGLAVAAASAANVAGIVTVTMTAPALPTGWAIVEAVALLIPAQNPQEDTMWNSKIATDAATPFAPAFTTSADGNYVWGCWFKFTKPDGTLAYSPSYTGVITVA